jgi:hypothetical protein
MHFDIMEQEDCYLTRFGYLGHGDEYMQDRHMLVPLKPLDDQIQVHWLH